jgi:hypothetical protein
LWEKRVLKLLLPLLAILRIWFYWVFSIRVAGVSLAFRVRSPTRTRLRLRGDRIIILARELLYSWELCLIILSLRKLNRLSSALLSCFFGYRALLYSKVTLVVRLRFVSVLIDCRLRYIDKGKRVLLTIGGEGWSLREKYVLPACGTPAIVLRECRVPLLRCGSLGGGCICCECWLYETSAIRSRFEG